MLVRFWIALVISLAAVFAGAIGFAAVESSELSIQVKSVVEISGSQTEILLGDLLLAQGFEAAEINDQLQELKSIRLADMPNAGESRSFTSLGLEQVFRPALRNIEGKLGRKITLRIPARVMVMRKSFRLLEADVKNEMTSQLKALCSECQFEFTQLTMPVVPTAVPAGSSWAIRLRHEIPKGNFSVPLEINNEDGSKRTYWISGTLVVSRKVAVSSHQLEAGDHVEAVDFSLQNKDVTFATDVPATTADFSGSVTARGIAAGQILWRSQLKREVAVKSGETVKVVAGAGDWQVSIDGVAQGSAYIGDTVNVKIPRTAKMVSGLLKEKGIVEVRQ